MIEAANGIFIDERDIKESFITASGPGGQHVNKSSTAVQLQFDIHSASSLPQRVKFRLKELASGRVSPDGILTIRCQTHRSQLRNREEAMERLLELIAKASINPKKRRPTKPSKKAKAKRLDSKKHRSKVKAMRGKVKGDD